jgi:hypothetical protein
MNLQLVIAAFILFGAIAYASVVFWKKTRSFSAKSGCDADCGCGNSPQKSLNNRVER